VAYITDLCYRYEAICPAATAQWLSTYTRSAVFMLRHWQPQEHMPQSNDDYVNNFDE